MTSSQNMERFYRLFPADRENLPQPGEELTLPEVPENLPQFGEEIFCLPWGYIKLIIDKCGKEPVFLRTRQEENQGCFVCRKGGDTG